MLQNKLKPIKSLTIFTFVIFLFGFSSNSGEKTVKSKIEYQKDDTDLLIVLTIVNNDNSHVYIPLSRWDVVCNHKSNEKYWYSHQNAWVNQILYFPEKYHEIDYMRDSGFNFDNIHFPKFIVVKPNDTIFINIMMNNYFDFVENEINYRMQIITPYFTSKQFESSLKYLELNHKDIVINNTNDTLDFVYEQFADQPLGNCGIWYINKYEDYCSTKKLSEKMTYALLEHIESVDTLRSETVIINNKQ